jgi:hypothetical protein
MNAAVLIAKIGSLRAELAELAFTLDREGSREAADVAMVTSARLDELCVEFTSVDFCPSAVRNASADSLNP